MFEKIIFPTDFSKPARTELHCITSITGIREIILFHVIKQYAIPMGVDTVENLELETTEVYLQEAKAYIAALNPAIRVTLEETIATDITGAILEKAEEHHASLIVIHAHVKGIISGVLLSCVSSKVLCRISKINVMVMPNTLVGSLTGEKYEKFCPMIFSRVLCPTNFSAYSEKTTTLAGNVKEMGEIILLHVVQNKEDDGSHRQDLATAENRIHALCDRMTDQGINARSIVVSGKPETEIPKIAQAEDVSLIWMRSAAHGCLHDFFFGSMVHAVVMNATRPVIVIRSYA
jgi:nucleotide-binding universal stress UspA family protein